MNKKDNNYTYILKCNDNTLYTGWTNSLENRILAHNLKKGAKYSIKKIKTKTNKIIKATQSSCHFSTETHYCCLVPV